MYLTTKRSFLSFEAPTKTSNWAVKKRNGVKYCHKMGEPGKATICVSIVSNYSESTTAVIMKFDNTAVPASRSSSARQDCIPTSTSIFSMGRRSRGRLYDEDLLQERLVQQTAARANFNDEKRTTFRRWSAEERSVSIYRGEENRDHCAKTGRTVLRLGGFRETSQRSWSARKSVRNECDNQTSQHAGTHTRAERYFLILYF